jgi:ABC-type sulfate transport system permease component
MVGAIERVTMDLEEASRTLGARPLTVFRTVIMPLTKYSLFAGTIMMFARSVDETGATLAVSKELKTAPVLLVSWVRGATPVSSSTMGLGVSILILTSFVFAALSYVIILIICRPNVRLDHVHIKGADVRFAWNSSSR